MTTSRPGRWRPRTEIEKIDDDLGTEYECCICHRPFRSRSILANHKHKKEVACEPL